MKFSDEEIKKVLVNPPLDDTIDNYMSREIQSLFVNAMVPVSMIASSRINSQTTQQEKDIEFAMHFLKMFLSGLMFGVKLVEQRNPMFLCIKENKE